MSRGSQHFAKQQCPEGSSEDLYTIGPNPYLKTVVRGYQRVLKHHVLKHMLSSKRLEKRTETSSQRKQLLETESEFYGEDVKASGCICQQFQGAH
jgi:NAD(P)H-flavin reductase